MKAEIVCVIDRSGSMSSIKDDAIGGFNTFLKAQKEVPGEAKLTLVLFDTEYLIEHDGKDIQSVPELTDATYVPRGMTALYDAIGRAIDSVGSRLAGTSDRPDKVIVAILTDGQENASQEYTHSRIAEMIKHQREKYQWEFVFLAANQDAFATADSLNIKRGDTHSFAATGQGIRTAYGSMTHSVSNYRK